MSHQRAALAAILGVPLALLMTRPASLQALTLELLLGCVFIGFFVTGARENEGFHLSALIPPACAAVCGGLTLAFLAFAYDQQARRAPDVPFFSGVVLSFKDGNPATLSKML